MPGVDDEEGRASLRAQIDAIVARDVYGLTRDQLSYVLDTFPIVEKRDVKRHGHFRTKTTVLAAFDSQGLKASA